jgi:hypothetical protein
MKEQNAALQRPSSNNILRLSAPVSNLTPPILSTQ